jgi:hypothetical protein
LNWCAEDCADVTRNHDGAGDAEEDVPAITPVRCGHGYSETALNPRQKGFKRNNERHLLRKAPRLLKNTRFDAFKLSKPSLWG